LRLEPGHVGRQGLEELSAHVELAHIGADYVPCPIASHYVYLWEICCPETLGKFGSRPRRLLAIWRLVSGTSQ
jgi:hypothetical protein